MSAPGRPVVGEALRAHRVEALVVHACRRARCSTYSTRIGATTLGVTTESLERALKAEHAPPWRHIQGHVLGHARTILEAGQIVRQAMPTGDGEAESWEQLRVADGARWSEAVEAFLAAPDLPEDEGPPDHTARATGHARPRHAPASQPSHLPLFEPPAPALESPAQAALIAAPPLLVLPEEFVAVDVETTGFSKQDRVIELGMALFRRGELVQARAILLNPGVQVPRAVTDLTGITTADARRAPRFESVGRKVHAWLAGRVVVAHSLAFDRRMLTQEFERLGLAWPEVAGELDTATLSGRLGGPKRPRLDVASKHFGVEMGQHHRAQDDAVACGRLLIAMARRAA